MVLYVAKHSALWIAMYVFSPLGSSIESPNHTVEFSLLYIIVLMDFSALVHCFIVGRSNRHSDIMDITRTQFHAVPKQPGSKDTNPSRVNNSMDLFSIDDTEIDSSERSNRGNVYLPTVSSRRDSRRKQRRLTLASFIKFANAFAVVAGVSTVTIGYIVRIKSFTAVLPIFVYALIITSLFIIPKFFSDEMQSRLKMIL
ncbi:hypothetical protein ACOME3_010118 [Neoechinorhynchus agilis]